MGLVYEILQTLIEGVTIENSGGRLAFANTALERLLGYGQDELLGAPWNSLFCEGSLLKDGKRRVAASGQPPGRHKTALLHRSGAEIPALVSSRCLPAGDGEEVILSTFSVLQEPQTQGSESRRTEAIDVASQQGSTLVHELNNSLAIIVLQSRLLANRGPTSRRYGEGLSVIQDQAQRMVHMVDSLRFSKDPFEPRMEAVDVNALLWQTLEIQQPQFLLHGLEVTTDLAAELPTTRADPHQLQQVFVNLINNARQAMANSHRDGSLMVSSRLSRAAGSNGQTIQIRFADNGPGIPAEVKPFIFEPFFTTKKRGKSMGLGLSICGQIVQRHEGTIWAEDNDAGGATFVFELPVVKQEVASATTVPEQWQPEPGLTGPTGVQAQGQHILVVDDEPAVALSTQQVLEQAGFQVTIASEAQQAFGLVDQNRIDLIVSDFSMPHMNGQEFWEMMVERHPNLTGRIIFATGDSSSRRARSFLQNCGCSWIEKPFQVHELVRLVHEVLPDEQDASPGPE